MTATTRLPLPKSGRRRTEDDLCGCLICGKLVDETAGSQVWHVQMSTSWEMIPNAEGEPEDSQGCFPVGPSCVTKIPQDYRILMTIPA